MNTLYQSIGNQIRRKRIEKHMTQKELSQGICSQAEISKIENGRNMPTIQLLEKIAKRLTISMSILIEDRVQIDRFQKMDWEILQLTREERYLDVIMTLENYRTEATDLEIDLLIEYYKVIAEYRLHRIDFRTASVMLSQLVDAKKVLYNAPYMYIRMKMAISIFYAENEQYYQAEKVYKELENVEYITDTMREQQLKILYNHAKLLFKMNNFEKGISIITLGIEQSVHLNHLSYIAHFYYQRAEFYEVMYGDDERTKNDYSISYDLFNALNMKRYAKIVEDTKHCFLKQIP